MATATAQGTLLEKLVQTHVKKTLDSFNAGGTLAGAQPAPEFEPSRKVKIAAKVATSYGYTLTPNAAAAARSTNGVNGGGAADGNSSTAVTQAAGTEVTRIVERVREEHEESRRRSPAARGELVIFKNPKAAAATSAAAVGSTALVASAGEAGGVLVRRQALKAPIPDWHAPWKLQTVVSGHLGWVRCIAFDPGNEWFVTGSADRTIKVWDLAKCSAGAEGGLKLTLTGHISTVRGLAVSPRHPYLFSASEDKRVLCWDLEMNKVIRHYHGHLSGIFALALHPTLDILVTGGRDGVARVWDMRTKQQIHVLTGHTDAVAAIVTNAIDPQVITGAHDHQVRLWDLAAGKTMAVLTHHKKAVRALSMHPREFSFVSAAADNIKRWQARDGMFLNNMSGHNAIINSLAVNEDNVLVSGGDNGSMCFWDYHTGYQFQRAETIVQPGSLDAEAGIFATCFDGSGTRLITGEADKTIKIYRENREASPETHPIDMKRWAKDFRDRKR